MIDRLIYWFLCECMLGEIIFEGLKEILFFEFYVIVDIFFIFIVLVEDDQVVFFFNSIVYYIVLLKYGVFVGLYIYLEGGYSFGFCDSFIYKELWIDEL